MPRTNGAPNLTQVARKARVSIATVSRILNGNPVAAIDTRERVLKAASDLGYVPDPRFRLMGQRSKGAAQPGTGNIGILLKAITEASLISDSFYTRLFWSVEREARENDRHLIISSVADESDAYIPQFIRDMKVDGVLTVSQCEPGLLERIGKLVPVVMVNGRDITGNTCAVMPDNAGGVERGMEYLRALGHERIVFFDILDAVPPNLHHAERRAAFETYLQKSPLPGARLLTLPQRTGTSEETAAAQLRRWVKAKTLPTAVFCADDHSALAFIQAAPGCGLRVPQDLSVIGFDDLVFDEYVRPRLTSMRQPMEEMGRAGIRKLFDLLAGRAVPGTEERFPLELIERDSCACVHTSPEVEGGAI